MCLCIHLYISTGFANSGGGYIQELRKPVEGSVWPMKVVMSIGHLGYLTECLYEGWP